MQCRIDTFRNLTLTSQVRRGGGPEHATERVPSVLMGQIGRQSFEAGTRFES